MKPILYGLPAAVLICAFAAICIHFHSAWPWNLAVHEDGHRTLLQTVFYFQHAAGELPVDILLAAAIAGAMLTGTKRIPVSPSLLTILAAIALAVDSAIVAGSALTAGVSTTWQFLMQSHTRDSEPLVFGSHWGYHFLSAAALMLLAMSFACGPKSTLLKISWGAFAVLSLAFGVHSSTFTDPRYLGHQARETLTHAVTSVPLAIAACWRTAGTTRLVGNWFLLPIGGALILTAYQAGGAILGGIGQHAQTTDPVRLVCTHFFEHSFSLIVVPAHAALFYALAARGKA